MWVKYPHKLMITLLIIIIMILINTIINHAAHSINGLLLCNAENCNRTIRARWIGCIIRLSVDGLLSSGGTHSNVYMIISDKPTIKLLISM